MRAIPDATGARRHDARRVTRLAPSPPAATTQPWLARGLAGLAAGLALLAVLGPLITGTVEYRFLTIALLDLGVLLPLTAATCAGLLRGRDWAATALLGVAGWFGLVGPAVAAMAIAMQLDHDPATTSGATLSLTALGLAFTAFAIWTFRPPARV
jgi:hypothetical protein